MVSQTREPVYRLSRKQEECRRPLEVQGGRAGGSFVPVLPTPPGRGVGP